MSPDWTELVRLSGSSLTVLFENPDKVLTAYARFLGNDENSILSFSFYIYEEIKIIKVVILFYIYTEVPVGFLLFERVFGGFGTNWFPAVIFPALNSGSDGKVCDREPFGARFFFSFFSGPPATATSLGTRVLDT